MLFNSFCLLQAVSNVTALAQVDREKIYQWINELSSPETRENALLELSKKRESVPDLAPMLWHSCGTIAALLQVRSVASLYQLEIRILLVFFYASNLHRNHKPESLTLWHNWACTLLEI